MALRPPGVERRIAAAPDVVWRLLVDLDQWPLWGPSVRRAEIRGGGRELTAGAHGSVWTAVGVPLPFAVTEFVPGSRWAWAVGGVPATGHQVHDAPGGCLVRFTAPWWAAAYLPVCSVALTKIEKLAV